MTNSIDSQLVDDIDLKKGGSPGKDDLNIEGGVRSVSGDSDDAELEALGYVPSFKREFTNLATVSEIATLG